jgi:Holliday junction resolvasome RuvABC ATP-dependent DNA helicase subunit
LLEDVFKRSGLPTYTFVEPAEYNHLKVALRTPGRGVVVEGPSGIGKTTAVRRATLDVGLSDRAQMLSGRNRKDQEIIAEMPNMEDLGVVVIDDFHRLDDATKHTIADYLKELADREDQGTKIILIGINRAGDSLVHFAADLNNRIDTIHFEVNDTGKVRELIAKGEEALNIQIACATSLADDAGGSFHVAQILCHEICLKDGVMEASDQKRLLFSSLESVKERVLNELSRTFLDRAVDFARGRRFRREGRAPYLHLFGVHPVPKTPS